MASLYPPRSPFDFSVIPVPVLGRAFEGYLGKRLRLEEDGLSIAWRPAIGRIGGVFNTPQWIVEYILERTLDGKLREKSPQEIASVRVLGPACGAGVFVAMAAMRILSAARGYYEAHPEDMGGSTAFPDARVLGDGSIELSAPSKAALIERTVHCVDADPTSVEATKMWLYILILEGEGSPVVTAERRYKIPNRAWPDRIRDFRLPDLSGNIVLGNPLVATDFSKDPEEAEPRPRLRLVRWRHQDRRHPARRRLRCRHRQSPLSLAPGRQERHSGTVRLPPPDL